MAVPMRCSAESQLFPAGESKTHQLVSSSVRRIRAAVWSVGSELDNISSAAEEQRTALFSAPDRRAVRPQDTKARF